MNTCLLLVGTIFQCKDPLSLHFWLWYPYILLGGEQHRKNLVSCPKIGIQQDSLIDNPMWGQCFSQLCYILTMALYSQFADISTVQKFLTHKNAKCTLHFSKYKYIYTYVIIFGDKVFFLVSPWSHFDLDCWLHRKAIDYTSLQEYSPKAIATHFWWHE